MQVLDIYLADEAATRQLAGKMAAMLTFPLVLTFTGEIGAGKTTFIRALLRAMGVKGAVKSPTFSLVESYLINDLPIHHFDLYRIHDEAELDFIGFRDFFTDQSFCCIEWPERAGYSLGAVDLQAAFAVKGSGRLLRFIASTETGEKILSCLTGTQ